MNETWLVMFNDLHNDGGDKVVQLTDEDKVALEALDGAPLQPGAEYDIVACGSGQELFNRLYFDRPVYEGPLTGTKRIKVPIY